MIETVVFVFKRVYFVYCRGTVFGITVLGFDENDKIDEVLTFMQPFPSQRADMFKSK